MEYGNQPLFDSGGSFNGGWVTNASTALNANTGGNELIVYQKVSIGTGTQR
jgi:hypothetical protein